MLNYVILASALLPAIILMIIVLVRDKEHPEPMPWIIKGLLYGVFAIFASLLISQPLIAIGIVPQEYSNAFSATLFSFGAAAIPEETAKLIFLWLLLRKNPFFDEYFDGIVYAVCIGLGFAAFENVIPSKVDRSAAYAARYIAKNMVAAGVADEMLVQISYAIGVAEPVSIYVNTYGRSHVNMSDGEIAKHIPSLFDLRPKAIEQRLKLRAPIYEETAAYGHMGREPQVIVKHFNNRYEGSRDIEVELFTWEKLDAVSDIKRAFGI